MKANVAQGEIISPVILSLYVMDMHLYSCHVELAVYAFNTAILISSGQAALIVKYMESYVSELQRLLKEYRTSINVSNSTAMLFARVSGIFRYHEQFRCSGIQFTRSISPVNIGGLLIHG